MPAAAARRGTFVSRIRRMPTRFVDQLLAPAVKATTKSAGGREHDRYCVHRDGDADQRLTLVHPTVRLPLSQLRKTTTYGQRTGRYIALRHRIFEYWPHVAGKHRDTVTHTVSVRTGPQVRTGLTRRIAAWLGRAMRSSPLRHAALVAVITIAGASASQASDAHRCADTSLRVSRALTVRYSGIQVTSGRCATARSVLRSLARARVRDFNTCGAPYANGGECEVRRYLCTSHDAGRGRAIRGSCDALDTQRTIDFNQSDVSTG